MQDPLAWGRVESKQWLELSSDSFESSELAKAPQRFLGRWAASSRGLKPMVEAADDDNSG